MTSGRRYGTDNGRASYPLKTGSDKAPAWPVSLRERYGSITLAEVVRFYLIRWHTHRNLRRCRKRREKQASWTSMIRRDHPRIRARMGRLRESHLLRLGEACAAWSEHR